MRQLHVEVNACTLRLLDATPTENLSDHTDLVESFYSFNTQVVKKLPEAFVNSGIDNTKLLMYGECIILGIPVEFGIGFDCHFGWILSHPSPRHV